jgi:hypothetical protein
MRKTVCRMAQTRIKPGPLGAAFMALELAAKNPINVGIFLIHNVISSFEKTEAGAYVLKDTLHENQIQALAEAELALRACNATRVFAPKEHWLFLYSPQVLQHQVRRQAAASNISLPLFIRLKQPKMLYMMSNPKG